MVKSAQNKPVSELLGIDSNWRFRVSRYQREHAQHGLLLFPDYEQIMKAGGGSGEYRLHFNTAAAHAQTAVFLVRMRGAP